MLYKPAANTLRQSSVSYIAHFDESQRLIKGETKVATLFRLYALANSSSFAPSDSSVKEKERQPIGKFHFFVTRLLLEVLGLLSFFILFHYC